jgi:hypothetical protein
VLGVVPADAVDARVRVLTVGGRHPLQSPTVIRSALFRPTRARGHHS